METSMTPFLMVMLLALTAFVGLGVYFGWFLLPSERSGFHSRITFAKYPVAPPVASYELKCTNLGDVPKPALVVEQP
jgi:hypothetical protein